MQISQLSPDGTTINRTEVVWSTPSQFSGIEGNRLYKRNGLYYAIGDAPSNAATLIWKAENIWGPCKYDILQIIFNFMYWDIGSGDFSLLGDSLL